jgi:hypothetical protein
MTLVDVGNVLHETRRHETQSGLDRWTIGARKNKEGWRGQDDQSLHAQRAIDPGLSFSLMSRKVS